MTKYKATYIGSSSCEKKYYNQHWEYRGKQYIVTVPTGWGASSDFYNNGYNSQKNQHKRAQQAIDTELDNPKTEEKRIERNGADEGFEMFWQFVNQ